MLDLVVLAHILNPLSDKKCEQFSDGALHLSFNKKREGYIVKGIGKRSDVLKTIKTQFQEIDYTGHVIIPSFFDMHFHWVQDDVREMPKANLLKWLDNYTFPAEKKFKNKSYSNKKAKEFFRRLEQVGTLGGACYSSIHGHTLEHAMDEVRGDFVIGNVLMTMNSPKELTQTKKEAVELVSKFSKKYKEKFALTPRFAIATDPATMKESAKIAKKNKSFIQSHLSETPNEIEFVTGLYKEMKGFEKVKTYTEIYKKVGILGSRTIMGHGIHLKPSEITMLKETDTAIAHCPTSNAPIKEKGLGSGLFDFKRIERNKIRWALGSDIGGGPILSMFDVMRSFIDQNKKAQVKGATHIMALYRSTLAGAKLLKQDKNIGNLSLGKDANFLVLPKMKFDNQMKAEDVIAIYIDKCRNRRKSYDQLVEKVFYKGQLLHSKT